MRNDRRLLVLSLVWALVLLAQAALADVGPTYAIVGCRIVPVEGNPYDGGVIIIRDGLIEALGPQSKVAIPEDAEVIKAEGLTAYPGLLDAYTNLFIETPREAPMSPMEAMGLADSPVKDPAVYPSRSAYDLLKPKQPAIDECLRLGITSALVAPLKGIIAGQSVLLNLNGERPEAMVVKNPVALHLNFVSARGVYPMSEMGTTAFLRQSLLDVAHYRESRAVFAKAGKGLKRPEYNPVLEALLSYDVENKPVVFNCQDQEEIKRALGLIAEFKLKAMILGGNEAWRVVEHLKKAPLPLLIGLNFAPPETSFYVTQGEESKKKAEEEIYPKNAAELYKAGIPFALTTSGLEKKEDFWPHVRKAVQAGLPAPEALRSMTIQPARFFGVDRLLGSLEPGKIADIILTEGEIFGEKTKVKMAFVDGLLFKIKEAPGGAPPSPDVGGEWKGTLSGLEKDHDVALILEKKGDKLTGRLSGPLGDWEIRDVTFQEGKILFKVQAKIQDKTLDGSFEGIVDKDEIRGDLKFPDKTAKLILKKAPGKKE